MESEARGLMQHVAAMELLAGVGARFNAARIPLMPLKGCWLQLEVYDPPHVRPLTDVDLLVPVADFERATQVCVDAGFTARPPDMRQVVLEHPAEALPLDLHRALFERASFRLDAAYMLARARGPERFRGVALLLPNPMDGFAHLVGHAARARTVPGEASRMRDFETLGQALQLDPVATAKHLQRCGMARATRYVLGALGGGHESFCARVLDALSPDPLGEVLAQVCRWAVPRVDLRNTAGGALTYLLEDSLARGCGALAWRAWARRGPRRRM